MIYVISDLHGYPFEKFLKILEKAGFCDDDFLYVLGDAVDRGEDGVKYLLWLMKQKNAQLLLGNHELMMRRCDFLFGDDAQERINDLEKQERRNLGLWMANGAETTVRGLFNESPETRKAILGYLNGLPLYKNIRVGDREYLLTHSGLRDFRPDKKPEDYSVDDLVWNRPDLSERYFDDKTVVFGHTPTWFYGDEYKRSIIVNDTWIDIDAGAAGGYPPVLLRLDDMAQFTL